MMNSNNALELCEFDLKQIEEIQFLVAVGELSLSIENQKDSHYFTAEDIRLILGVFCREVIDSCE